MQNEETAVCCLSSASEALDSITKDDYCLVILSNQLPGISSIEMLRIMRLTQQVPIIVLTYPLLPDDKIKLFQAGADAIVDKPINIDLSVAQANALIHLYASSDAKHGKKDQISFGSNFVIFPHFRQVYVDGQEVPLTRKEFDLLLYFAEHLHKVYSREQLYSRVWGDSFPTGGDETVKVHIQTLRKKIETKGRTLIHNVWGVGYKFVPPNEQLHGASG